MTMMSMRTKFSHLALILISGLVIASCSGEKMDPSSETFSSAANVHGNERVVAETAEIDAQLRLNYGAILGGRTQLFETETILLERSLTPETRNYY
tara:strand:- start:2919 stop:3206 length:288 start_codon:yes stop_codon:yes gene_type:complete